MSQGMLSRRLDNKINELSKANILNYGGDGNALIKSHSYDLRAVK